MSSAKGRLFSLGLNELRDSERRAHGDGDGDSYRNGGGGESDDGDNFGRAKWCNVTIGWKYHRSCASKCNSYNYK